MFLLCQCFCYVNVSVMSMFLLCQCFCYVNVSVLSMFLLCQCFWYVNDVTSILQFLGLSALVVSIWAISVQYEAVIPTAFSPTVMTITVSLVMVFTAWMGIVGANKDRILLLRCVCALIYVHLLGYLLLVQNVGGLYYCYCYINY